MRIKSIFTVLLLLLASAAEAREPGHYVPGIANIRDFAVPADPGFYYVQYNAFYSTDTYRDRNGNSSDSIEVGPITVDVEAGLQFFHQRQLEGDDGSDALGGSVEPEINGLGLQIAYWVAPSLNLSFKYIEERDAEARYLRRVDDPEPDLDSRAMTTLTGSTMVLYAASRGNSFRGNASDSI